MENLAEVRDLCAAHRGRCPIYFEITSREGWTATVKGQDGITVDPSDEFLAELQALVGTENVLCCGPRGPVAVN